MILCDDFFSFRYVRSCKSLNIVRSGPNILQRGVRNIIIASALCGHCPPPDWLWFLGCVARFTSVKGYNMLYVCNMDKHNTSPNTMAVKERITQWPS